MSKNHIFERMSDEKISELKTRWMKKHTFNNKMQWGVRAYNAWRTEKINNLDTFDVNIFDTNLND